MSEMMATLIGGDRVASYFALLLISASRILRAGSALLQKIRPDPVPVQYQVQ